MHSTMSGHRRLMTALASYAAFAGAGSAFAGVDPSPVLTVNPGFLDVDSDGLFGDGWGVFGAAAVDFQFFGDGNDGHATLFGDNIGNTGAVFQTGIPASAGTTYEATFRIQWESNWDARTLYGLEFYGADDATKLGETVIEITEDRMVGGTGYRRYDIEAEAPEGTAFVRPVVLFDEVLSAGSSRACTVDNVLVREKDTVLSLNPGFGDVIGDGLFPADFWGTFGAAAIDFEFFPFADPGHATIFADGAGNSGGIFQQGVPAEPGESYTMSVALSFEENYDAETFIGMEFYGSDDFFLIGLAEAEIDELTGLGYVVYQLEATAPASFTRFVRPVVRFGNAVGAAELAAGTIDSVLVVRTSDLTLGCNDADLAEPLGVLDLADITAFVAGFTGQDPVADLDGNGTFDLQDINAFVIAFTGGCP
jgi:hypothetical protein